MTKEEKEICRKYSTRDENGKVHCDECPLGVPGEIWCKACEDPPQEVQTFSNLFG